MPSKYEYITCMRTKRNSPDTIFHRFPSKKPELLHKWIICSGKTGLLYLETEKLYGKCICEDHFIEESFMDPAHRKRLRPSAVPIPYSEPYKQPSSYGTSQSTMTPTFSLSEMIVPTLFSHPSTSQEMMPLKEDFSGTAELPELKVNVNEKVYSHSVVKQQVRSFTISEPEIDQNSAAEVHYLQDLINMPPPQEETTNDRYCY